MSAPFLDEVISRSLSEMEPWLEQLIDSVTPPQQQALRVWIGQVGSAGVIDWDDAHEADIDRFLCSTPSEQRRDKRLAKLQPQLTYAAIRRLFDARKVLHVLYRSGLCTLGHDWRSIATDAGKAMPYFAMTEDVAGDLTTSVDDYPEASGWPWDEPWPVFTRGDRQ